MTYRQARIKFRLEQILNMPFILSGMLIGYLFPQKKGSPYYLFFASDTIGGATKVNADILKILAPYGPSVIFSKRYGNSGFAAHFQLPGVQILDFRDRIDNKYRYFLNIVYRGILAAWINRADAKVVFGGESLYFYKVIPYLKKSIKVVELCHLPTWLNYSQALIPYIDQRIVSVPKLKRNIEAQYAANGVPAHYLERLSFIDNWVEIPDFKKQMHETLRVLFVGRGAAQKRVHLISRIAEELLRARANVEFTFVGDVSTLVSDYVREHTGIHEFISDPDELAAIYDRSDILILTSAYEGLPIVVMDMMVRGKVVLSTAVDGIPDYITHLETGLLIQELENEDEIVREGAALIRNMQQDRQLLKRIGDNAYRFARERFLRNLFEARYRDVFGIA
jgi:glycosyltransferase involved in cell wall biosynthesis